MLVIKHVILKDSSGIKTTFSLNYGTSAALRYRKDTKGKGLLRSGKRRLKASNISEKKL